MKWPKLLQFLSLHPPDLEGVENSYENDPFPLMSEGPNLGTDPLLSEHQNHPSFAYHRQHTEKIRFDNTFRAWVSSFSFCAVVVLRMGGGHHQPSERNPALSWLQPASVWCNSTFKKKQILTSNRLFPLFS